MKSWFETIDGKPYLVIEVSPEEVKLLTAHHEAISSLTNFDFSSVFDINKSGCPMGSISKLAY